jgi:hypothetical protein
MAEYKNGTLCVVLIAFYVHNVRKSGCSLSLKSAMALGLENNGPALRETIKHGMLLFRVNT